MADARPVQYGKRKLGPKKWAEQQAKNKLSTREGTVYGKRKKGMIAPSAAPVAPKDVDAPNPFLQKSGSRVSVQRLEEILEGDAKLLDLAIETELSHPDKPRKSAVEVLTDFEAVRAGGPRESVTKLLSKLQKA